MATAGGQAYEAIRRSILDGAFAPGARLKEEELTALCGVSRTPVREALKRLAAEGLVVLAPHQGAQVVALDPADLEERYALRAMVEGHAAARAAARITPEALAALMAVQAELEAVVAQTVATGDAAAAARFLPLNDAFHQGILDAAESPRLAAMALLVIELPFRRRTLSRYSPDELERSMQHHRELLAALQARDAEWAGSTMRSHVRAALQVLLRGEPAREAPAVPPRTRRRPAA